MRDRSLFVIANYFTSKGGDNPLFGRVQPPVLSSEAQRPSRPRPSTHSSPISSTAIPRVAVLGNLNDFPWSPPLQGLVAGGVLVNLHELDPEGERCTYVFQGNAQILDHALVGPALARLGLARVDVVHTNAEFADQISDHYPLVTGTLVPPRLPQRLFDLLVPTMPTGVQ